MKKRFRKSWANCPSCYRCPDRKECNLDIKKNKNPLTKEQLLHIDNYILEHIWQNGPDYLFPGKNWNLTKIRDDNKNGD